MNIDQICKKYHIENYKINPDGSIDVDGNVTFYNKKLTILPLNFNTVTGTFLCNRNQLTTLEGSPKMVGGNFWCNRNQLTTLEGSPKTVGGEFWCHENQLIPYDMRYVLFSDISGEFYSGLGNIDNTMNIYFSLSEQEKKQEIFKIMSRLHEWDSKI